MAPVIPGLPVHHPLIHGACPTLDVLKSRADTRARKVLDTASALAQWRLTMTEQIRDLRKARGAHPWPAAGNTPPCHVGSEPVSVRSPDMLPADLLRALLATEPEAISRIVPSPNQALAQASSQWSQLAQDTTGPAPALDFAWARRFAIADMRHDRPPVDVSYLIASLGYDTWDALVPFSALSEEGSASKREVLRQCVVNARQACGDRLFEPLLPAYFDRHGGMDALDLAMQQHHGVLIVGHEETGRTALLEAWLQRLVLGPRPPEWEGLRVFQNPFDEPWAKDPSLLEKMADSAIVLALAPKGRRVFYDPREEDPLHPDQPWPERLWAFEPEYPDGSLETRLVEHCAQWASEPWKRVFIILVVTPAERERLVARVPLIAQFPAVDVPAFATQDHLPIWLCHTMERPRRGLEQALAIMSELRPADVLAMRPWDVQTVLGSGLAQRLWEPGKLERLRPDEWLERALARIRQGHAPWQREMLGAKGRFVDRFIGDDERFLSLVRLQDTLRGGPPAQPEKTPTPPSLTPSPADTSRARQRLSTRVPPHSKDVPPALHFVFRRHLEGPMGKRVRRIRATSVLEWFQMAWQEVPRSEDPEGWIAEVFGGPVPGMTSLFQDVVDEGLDAPLLWEELEEILQNHLYVSGGSDDIRVSAHTLRVNTADDDVETSYFLFDETYAKANPDRCAYLLHDTWPLPTDAGQGPFDPGFELSPLLPPGEKSGATYACVFASVDGAGMSNLRARVFPGVMLPDLCEHLRRVVPRTEQRRGHASQVWAEPWPLELRLLRAMIDAQGADLTAALERCKRYPLSYVATHVQHASIGTGAHAHARDAFLEAASDARELRRDLDRTRIVVADHIAQMSLWTNDTFGYQQWYLFDDAWASAHVDLARSLLRSAFSWDPMS